MATLEVLGPRTVDYSLDRKSKKYFSYLRVPKDKHKSEELKESNCGSCLVIK